MGKKKVIDLDDFIVSAEKVNGRYIVLGKRSDYGEEESKEDEVPRKKKQSPIGKFFRDIGGANKKLQNSKKNTVISIPE